jgi:BirA family transcriptional regulator, biotin operon repressor / biotin---[acetyl-CoA-carboxylase] ligase
MLAPAPFLSLDVCRMRDDATGSDRSPEPPPSLDLEALRAALMGLRLGHPLVYFPAIASTNTHAAELARAGAAEGTLVTTDDQAGGRGRIGRSWKSMPGRQLALSLVLRPAFPPHFLVMASALAVAEAVEAVAGVATAIKWPNDVLVNGRKVSGILIETSADFAILGIGVNVNGSLAADPELAGRAATLAEIVGRDLPREPLAADLLRRLNTLYYSLQRGGDEARSAVRQAWRERLVTLGRRVSIVQGERTLAGLAEDVDADGMLLLRDAAGTLHTVTWGDVGS